MHINDTRFRLIVAASFLLFCYGLIAAFIGENSLPPELKQYIDAEYEKGLSGMDWFFLALLILWLLSHIGVFFFARWSRPVFAIISLFSCIISAIDGPSVQTGLQACFTELSTFCTGVAVACMYFTDIKKRFSVK